MMFHDRKVFSHRNVEQDGQPIGFEFEEGEEVKVEFDPTAGSITYILASRHRVYTQAIDKHQMSEMGPVHFCAYVYGAADNPSQLSINKA